MANAAAGATSATILNVTTNGDHFYVVRPVSTSGDVGADSSVVKATLSAPPSPITHNGAPLSSSAVYQDNNTNGTVDTADILRITFDETMSAPAASASLTLTDGSTIGTVTNGVNSTWTLSGTTTYVITLTGAPVISTSGATPGIQYPATVTAATGVQDTAASNSPAVAANWNPATPLQDFTF